jgi:hypothetical protein
VSGAKARFGLRAWLDELWIVSLDGALRPTTPALAELACNVALGTLKAAAPTGSAMVCEQLAHGGTSGPGDLPSQPAQACVDVVHRNPHAATAGTCRRAGLLGLPTLSASGARPATTTNPFCLACHVESNPTPGLKVAGPLGFTGAPLYADPRRQPSNPPPVWHGPRLPGWTSTYVVPADASTGPPPSASTVDPIWTTTGFR